MEYTFDYMVRPFKSKAWIRDSKKIQAENLEEASRQFVKFVDGFNKVAIPEVRFLGMPGMENNYIDYNCKWC